MRPVSVRRAAPSDLERVVEIHDAAYPESGSYARQERDFFRGALGGIECLRVAEIGGGIVGTALLYDLEIWLGGRRVRAGGVASLAVAPEARRQGIARSLLEASHAELAERGAAFSLLYPFDEAFYAKLGYAVTSPLCALRVPARSLLEPTGPLGECSIAALDGPLVMQAKELYDSVSALRSGRLVRPDGRWVERLSEEHLHWMGAVDANGRLQAYASFTYALDQEKQQRLVVREMLARTAAARRSLLQAFGRQCDQAATVALTVAYDDPLIQGLHGATAKVERGPMVRLIDVAAALTARGYDADGDLRCSLTDDPAANFQLSVRAGVAELTHDPAPADVRLSRATLGSMVVAGLLPHQAAELGLLEAPAAALHAAEAIFQGPRFDCLDPF